jgi:UDP-N-acetylmuramoyl-tripeptide--D-alanyl-D-alanine ligase
MDTQALYQLFTEFPRISNDTRNILPNSIYFALKGDRFDGNTFASQALEKGAKYAIIDNSEFYIDERTIIVKDSLKTLQLLANYHRHNLNLPIIAITGSNGKTTTKELVRSVLSKRYNVWATHGNLNNHIGVPLTILSMTSETQIGVVEMGANHPFEIENLCKIAEPNFGIITNIGKAHLEGFGGFEGVIKTKKELYDFLTANNGTVFYNSDNHLLSGLIQKWNKKVSYGPKTGTNCNGRILSSDPYLEVEFNLMANKPEIDKIKVRTNLVGEYNFENILAAATLGQYFQIPSQDIKKALEEYIPTNNRSQLIKTSKNQLLLDLYNANPSSTEAAIINFSKIKSPNKIVILGDMLELGSEAEIEHLKVMKLLVSYPDLKVILVGRCYKSLATPFGFSSFIDSEELLQWLKNNPVADSFILIKGSRGIQLEKVADAL